jgi:hypothetical protein
LWQASSETPHNAAKIIFHSACRKSSKAFEGDYVERNRGGATKKSPATQTLLDLNPLENLSTVTPIMAAQKNAIMGVSLAILPHWSAITAPRYVVGYRWKLSHISTNAAPFNHARRADSHTLTDKAQPGG